VSDSVRTLSEKTFGRVRKLRRTFHRYPELAHQEERTSELIRENLESFGISTRSGVGGTGVVGLLEGQGGSRVAGYRADMDALPILENTGLSFRSKNTGRMHACGHDSHMAMALGTAAVLSEHRDWLNGSVKFIFQPAEEVPPGGANMMIADGCLTDPEIDMLFALHVDPTIPTGKIAVKDGPFMAGVRDFEITVHGRGGHAAKPHEAVDAIVVACSLVTQLQTIASRFTDPMEPTVVTVGKIDGGTTHNIVADRVNLTGTIRGMSSRTLSRVSRQIERLCRHVTKSYGATSEIEYSEGYNPLLNSRNANEFIRSSGRELYGARSIIELENPLMTAEDFAHYLEHVPGAMFRLGVRNDKAGSVYPWHHSQFTIDEDAMKVGVAVASLSILRFLEGN